MISGGWEYIRAAYAVTWIVLGLYAVSLWARNRHLSKKENRSYENF